MTEDAPSAVAWAGSNAVLGPGDALLEDGRERSRMGTKTITKYVSDMDEQEIAAGQAYQLTIRHPDGSTQQLDISAQNYKGLKLEGLGKMAKKRGRKPGSGTAKVASATTGTRRRRRRSANGNAKPAAS
jgi:hypothetical protein